GGPQQAHERVPKDCVPQMPDVGSFVWIDAGVLDQRMHRLKRRDYPRADGEGLYRRRAIEASVDITRTRHLEGEKSRYGSEPSNNLFSDFARGLAQLASQFKRH